MATRGVVRGRPKCVRQKRCSGAPCADAFWTLLEAFQKAQMDVRKLVTHQMLTEHSSAEEARLSRGTAAEECSVLSRGTAAEECSVLSRGGAVSQLRAAATPSCVSCIRRCLHVSRPVLHGAPCRFARRPSRRCGATRACARCAHCLACPSVCRVAATCMGGGGGAGDNLMHARRLACPCVCGNLRGVCTERRARSGALPENVLLFRG
jgi:hypothetical protein